jgi:hypothetical protein
MTRCACWLQTEVLSRGLKYRRFPRYYAFTFSEDFAQAPSILACNILNSWIGKTTGLQQSSAMLNRIYELLQRQEAGRSVSLSLQDWDLTLVGSEFRLAARDAAIAPIPLVDTGGTVTINGTRRSVRVTHSQHIRVHISSWPTDASSSSLSNSSAASVLNNWTMPLALPLDMARSTASLALELRPVQEFDVLPTTLRQRPVIVKNLLRSLRVPLHLRDRVLVLMDKDQQRCYGGKWNTALAVLIEPSTVRTIRDSFAVGQLMLQEHEHP